MKKVILSIQFTFVFISSIFAQVIVVDGVKDTFYDGLTGPDDGYIQIQAFHHSEVGAPDDNADLSVKVWGAWDADWFYLYAEITDDSVSLAGATANWQTDGMQLQIDGVPDDSTQGSVSGSYIFTAIDSSDADPEDKSVCDNLDNLAETDKMYARGTMSGGYILEYAIRIDTLGGSESITGAVDGIFGLGMSINDNDGANRDAAEVWAAECDDNIWNTVKLHGTVKFLADNKVQFLATNNMTGRSNPLPFDGSDIIIVNSPNGGETLLGRFQRRHCLDFYGLQWNCTY